MDRRFITKKSLIFIIALLALALLFFFIPKKSGQRVEIWLDGELYDSYPLFSPFSLTLDNGVRVTGDGKSAHFEESDCPDKVCIKTGELSVTGEWAACLPNKTVVKIVGRNGDADTVS